MEQNKVFVLGFHKTGTTSLETALTELGYKVYGGDKNLLKYENRDELREYILKLMQNWDAVQDMPWPLFYKELYEFYPSAKFILTYREPEVWIKSVVRYFAKMHIPLHQKIYKVPSAEGYEETYLKIYNDYNIEVQKFFADKNNFLLMKMGKNFDYKTLCEFLGIINVPENDFPRSRKNAQKLSKYKLYRMMRSAYWNFRKNY